MTATEPSRTSSCTRELSITGYFLLWNEDRGVLRMPGTEDLFLAVFSSMALLQTFVDTFDIAMTPPKIVEDGAEFLATVRPHLRVMADPYRKANGMMGCVEIRLRGEALPAPT